MGNVNKIQCKAKSKRSGERCKNYCSPGKVVCKWHGGASNGAPKGNKSAVTTGQYEKIFPGCMTLDEISRADEMNMDALVVLEQEIKVTRIRETRILQRIAEAMKKESLAGNPTGERDDKGREKKHSAMVPIGANSTTGSNGAMNTLQQESHSIHILRLENALTSVQGHLAKLVTQREEFSAALGVNGDAIFGAAIYSGIPSHLIGPAFGQFIHDVRNDAATHFWHKGGRGSLKSTTISEALIDDLVRHPDSHAVVLRNTFNTLHDSVYSQLIWAIDQLGLADSFTARKSPLGIIYNATGQTIFFRGLDDPLKLKSIKPKFGYIRNIWFEEVAEIGGMETIRNVLQSLMRGGEVFHCFYSYNPPKSRNNWVNVAVEEEALRPDTKVYHTDYLTVPRPWLGEPFLAQAEHLKSVNETAYRHEYLGEATGTGGDVFDNVALEELPDGFSCQMERHGIDFGYATDPFAWIHCGYDRLYDTLYIFDEFYRIKVHDDEAARTIKQKKAGAFAHYCDCADPKAIANLQREGLNTYACKKFSGSRDHGYRFLQRWAKIVIDPRRCPNAAREFAACEYERNKDGEFVAVIPKKDDHTIDAVRYALDREIDGARAATSTYVSMA